MDKVTLRKVQLVQLEIAKEIKRVCELNDINYFLDSGTLLGAIRHNGFIPWDDDLDMGMMRTDFERFLELAPNSISSKYEIVTWNSEKGYPHPMIKVVKKGTIYIEEKRKDNAKQGIWVDVFAYDNVPKNAQDIKRQGNQIMLNRALIRAKCHYQTWHSQGKFIFSKWIKNLPIRVLSLFYSKEYLVKKYEYAAKRFNDCESEYVFTNGSCTYGKWTLPSTCFNSLVEKQFEDTLFKVPADYDLYLRTVYGDYMQLPPEDKRENRHSIIKIDFGEE